MGFSPSFLDELRLRNPIADVVGRRVKLIRRGREYTGLCPFHNEKTPSFTVSDEKGFYHCFGCGAHGDVITFVMEKEGLTFPEAVERLAQDAGLEMPEQTHEDRMKESRRASLADVNEAAALWFSDQLAGARGEDARAYVTKRGLSPRAVRDFRLGFAPSGRTFLKQALLSKGLDETLLIEAGLLIKPDDGGESYDRFRNRLMFPIRDRRGRVIAFGGRAMEKDAPAKYLNSPETPLFHKGLTLYNLDQAQKSARDGAQIIVAEGYMDVIALVEGGFQAAVAPLGTALTEDQLRILWRMAPEPVLCFDGDKAGVRAAQRAADRALPLLEPGHSLRFALLSDGDDPDSLIRGKGASAFQDVLDRAIPLAELLWDMETRDADLSTPERRAALSRNVRAKVREIANNEVRGFYEDEMRTRLDKLFGRGKSRPKTYENRRFKGSGGFQKRFEPQGASSFLKANKLARPNAEDDRTHMLEQLILTLLLNHPGLLHQAHEELAELPFSHALVDKAVEALLSLSAHQENLDSQAIRDTLRETGLSRLLDSLNRDAVVRRVAFAAKDADVGLVQAGFRHILARLRRMNDLERERAQAVAELEQGGSEAAYNRLKAVMAELESAAGMEIDFALEQDIRLQGE